MSEPARALKILAVVTLLAAAALRAVADRDRSWAPPERVLFVMIDTLRPDHLGCYGYDRPTSPTIDALARDGALFLDVRSTSAWTKPAIASLFSGVGPVVHGVEKGSGAELRKGVGVDALTDAWTTLPEIFRQHGFATMGFCANPHVAAGTGLAQGFDSLRWSGQRGEGLIRQVLDWLDAPIDVGEDALRRYAASPENLLRGWRRRSPDVTPDIDIERLDDRWIVRPATAAKPKKASLLLGTVPASVAGRHQLMLRARRDGNAKVRLLAVPDHGRDPGRLLLAMTFSLLEDGGIDHAPVEIEGSDAQEIVLEVTLYPGTSFELHDAMLVPESETLHAERWFAYLHFMHTHLPYPAAPEHVEQFPPRGDRPRPLPERAKRAVGRQRVKGDQDVRVYEARYDAAIHQVDDQLGRILRRMEELDLLAGTLIVVTSDHGEEFLEHGAMSHGHSLYDELLRIPWILHLPGVSFANRRPTSPVSILDLYPTVIDIMGWSADVTFAGNSQLPALTKTGDRPEARRFFATHTPILMDSKARLDALIDGAWKLIRFQPAGRLELYHLAEDPLESQDLAAAEPAVVERLTATLDAEKQARRNLRRQLARSVEQKPLSEETQEQLRSLGYID